MALVLIAALPMPIIGTIVRYRATYTPKTTTTPTPDVLGPSLAAGPSSVPGLGNECSATTLDEKSGLDSAEILSPLPQAPSTSELPPTFWRVFAKVWRTDQFEGLFRGIFPGIVYPFIFSEFFVSPAPRAIFVNKYTALPWNILYLLALASTYRVIVSPYPIRLAEPRASFRRVFTEYERSRYLLHFFLYTTASLPLLLSLLIEMLAVQPVRKAIGPIGDLFKFDAEPEFYKIFNHPQWDGWMRFGLHLVLAVCAVMVYTPLDVITTRLVVQPVNGKPSTESMEERDVERLGPAGVGVAQASIFNFTTEQKPYRNVLDCFKRIKEEEGWGVLYRSWWLTLLGVWTIYGR